MTKLKKIICVFKKKANLKAKRISGALIVLGRLITVRSSLLKSDEFLLICSLDSYSDTANRSMRDIFAVWPTMLPKLVKLFK